jgi:hypothetical protein
MFMPDGEIDVLAKDIINHDVLAGLVAKLRSEASECGAGAIAQSPLMRLGTIEDLKVHPRHPFFAAARNRSPFTPLFAKPASQCRH